MVSTLLENILVKTDTLIDKVFRSSRDREPVDFGRYLNEPEKILLLADQDLAGACLAMSFIPHLHNKFPSTEIGVALNPFHATILDGQENVTALPWGSRTPHQLDSGFRRLCAEIREQDFHWGLNMACGGRAEALMLHAASVAVRTGIALGDNEKYYNLVVRSPADGGQVQRMANLLRVLKVDVPAGGLEPSLEFTSTERERAQRFIRQRKSGRGNDKFVAFATESGPGGRGMERLLQRTCMRLVSEYEPLQLLVAGDPDQADELKKNEQLSPHLFVFDDLRQMTAVLSCCDRVVTGSAGLAWLLGNLGVRVALIIAGRDRMAELGIGIPDNVTLIRENDEGGAEELAVRFTR